MPRLTCLSWLPKKSGIAGCDREGKGVWGSQLDNCEVTERKVISVTFGKVESVPHLWYIYQ